MSECSLLLRQRKMKVIAKTWSSGSDFLQKRSIHCVEKRSSPGHKGKDGEYLPLISIQLFRELRK